MNGNHPKHGRFWMGAALVILSLSCQDRAPRAAAPLEPYIEAELSRLEETYRILERYAKELWPGWTNYVKIPVKVNFPNGVTLLVTQRSDRRPGFERVAGRSVHGKAVFLNRQDQTPVELRPPLFAQRGRGGSAIELDMGQPDLPSAESERTAALEARLKEERRSETPFAFAPLGDSDSHILMYLHEHFHGHQSRFPRFQGAPPSVALLRRFQATAEYAAWSHIEGLALRRAYLESQDAAALDILKDFLAAREIKRALMPRGTAPAEARISLVEGTPSYVSLKTAMLLREASEKPGVDRSKDPFFYDYAYVDGYIDNIMRKGMDFAVSWSEDTRGKYYLYGAYQCFLLDRFAPGWKRDLFETERTLDSAMSGLLKISDAEKEEIKRRLPARYGYDEIFALHDKALRAKKGP